MTRGSSTSSAREQSETTGRETAMGIDPKATAYELEALACDPDNWHLLDEIAAHPASWPELRMWVEEAKEHPDTVGPPPLAPDEPRQGLIARLQARFKPLTHRSENHRDQETSDEDRCDESETVALNLGPCEQGTVTGAARPEKRGGLLRGRPVIIAVIAVMTLTLLAGGGYAVGTLLGPQQQKTQSEQQNEDAGRKTSDQRDKAMAAAEQLLERIERSPVAGDIDHTGLEQAMKADDIERVVTETETLETQFLQLIDDRSAATGESIAQYMKRADAMASAPETAEKTELLALAGEWKEVQITETNLGEALIAEQRLSELTTTVEQQKRAADEETAQREQDMQHQQSTTPMPSPPIVQAEPIPVPQPQAPSWSVPGETQNGALPGKDGSL